MNKKLAHTITASLIALGCSLLTAVQPVRADESAENILGNGSMEQADPFTGDDSAPAFWTEGSDIAGVKYRWVIEEPKKPEDKKNAYLRITKTAKRYFPIASWEQTVDCDSDAPAITVTAKVKAVKVTKAIVDVMFINEKDEQMEHKWVAYIGQKGEGDNPADHDWKEYSGTVAIPKGCKKISIILQDYGPGTVMFDDVTAAYETDTSKIKDILGLDMSSEAAAQKALAQNASIPTDSLPSNFPQSSSQFSNNPAISWTQATRPNPLAKDGFSPSPPQLSGQLYSVPGTQYAVVQPITSQPVTGQLYAQPSYGNGAVTQYANRVVDPFQPPNGSSYQAFDPGKSSQPDAIFQVQTPNVEEKFVNGQSVRAVHYITKYGTADGQQFSKEESAKVHAATLKLTAQYRKDTDPVAKAKTREALVAAINSEYDLIRSERLKEIEELTTKLEEIKTNLDKRDKVKDKIIEKRVEQLLGVEPLYEWSNGSESVSLPQSTQYRPSQTPAYQPIPASLPGTTPAR